MNNDSPKCQGCSCSECLHRESIYQAWLRCQKTLECVADLLEWPGQVIEAQALIAATLDRRLAGGSDTDGGRLGAVLVNRYEPMMDGDPESIQVVPRGPKTHKRDSNIEHFERELTRFEKEETRRTKEAGVITTEKQTRILDAARELEHQVEAQKRNHYSCADVASMAGTSHSHTHSILIQAMAKGTTFKHLQGVGVFKKP